MNRPQTEMKQLKQTQTQGWFRSLANWMDPLDFKSGANDIIVVQQPDGTFVSTPFVVRFGRLKVTTTRTGRVVRIKINNTLNPDVYMRIGGHGEAFFVHAGNGSPPSLPTPDDLAEELDAQEQVQPTTTTTTTHITAEDEATSSTEATQSTTAQDPPTEAPPSTCVTPPPESTAQEVPAAEAPPSTCVTSPPEGKPETVEGDDDAEGKENTVAATAPKVEKKRRWLRLKTSLLNVTQWQLFRTGTKLDPCSSHSSLTDLGETLVDDEFAGLDDSEDEEEEEPLSPTSIKTLYPTSSQLAKLHLKEGANDIEFNVNTALSTWTSSGQTVSARIFLYPHSAKFFISDIDGTVTRSDVLGQILPMVGRDYSHYGIAGLYQDIVENGYYPLYLSSRSVSQVEATRSYIHTLAQKGEQMPPGPVLVSPNRLFNAITQEVIYREPQKFKAAMLSTVRQLFPIEHNPFYAGFGNRLTDIDAYRLVSVSEHRIFIINSAGVITVKSTQYNTMSSYTTLQQVVDQVFPPRHSQHSPHLSFNDYNFWKVPLTASFSAPVADVDGILVAAQPAASAKGEQMEQQEGEEPKTNGKEAGKP